MISLALALFALSPADPPESFPVNVVMNGGFELVADSTTDPPKYGAYWRDAFVLRPNDPTDLIVEYGEENHALELLPGADPVSQILTLYGPFSAGFELHLRVHFVDEDSELLVDFSTQGPVTLPLRVALAASDSEVEDEDRRLHRPIVGPDEDGFHDVRLSLGALVAERDGEPPGAWSRIAFAARGGAVRIDDVVGVHRLPRISPTELRQDLLAEIRDYLRIHVDSPDDGGLELIDPETGYHTGVSYDVTTGEILARGGWVGIGGIHGLMVSYLRSPDHAAEAAELREVIGERLRTHVLSVLKNNVYEPTSLYCLYDRNASCPVFTVELSPSHFIGYVLDVAELFPEHKVIGNYARYFAARVADTMVDLRNRHDLPRNVLFAPGEGGNWHGRMPEKVSPLGRLAEPKKSTYDQAWAISQNRSWYHDFDTCVGLMRVYAFEPKPEYRAAVLKVIELFDREFDATRYDLENDTDDHYGRNVETALQAYRAANGAVPELLAWAQAATDYRLPRDRPWDQNLWVEGIRLGSFTTGDQPRAFLGPVGLFRLPEALNPETSGFAPYRETLREFARMDLKRRLLDDGYMTEASSYQWEMISACFLGNYIAPCSEGLDWEGDMGDLFEGPASNGFRALVRALEIDALGPNRELVAWYQTVFEHTLARYRQPYGYRTGMPIETGRRYQIPDRYLNGFSDTSYYGMANVLLHAELVESGALDRDPASIRIDRVSRGEDGRIDVELSGPPGRAGRLLAARETRWSQVHPTDGRLRRVARGPEARSAAEFRFDDDGRASLKLEGIAGDRVVLDAELPTIADGSHELEDLVSGEFELGP